MSKTVKESSTGKYFFVNTRAPLDAAEIKFLEEFNALVKKYGCYAHIPTASAYDDEFDFGFGLVINYEKTKNSRGAGRKRKMLSQEHRYIMCGEVRKMIEDQGANNTAAELGVSRATLFRRLKDKFDDSPF